MKVSIDIECSPEEARQLMGLPDVAAMNEELVAALGDKLRATLSGKEPEALFGEWFAGGFEGLEKIQKDFWAQFTGGTGGTGGKSES
jgi:Family of unknown function (DUF6489)